MRITCIFLVHFFTTILRANIFKHNIYLAIFPAMSSFNFCMLLYKPRLFYCITAYYLNSVALSPVPSNRCSFPRTATFCVHISGPPVNARVHRARFCAAKMTEPAQIIGLSLSRRARCEKTTRNHREVAVKNRYAPQVNRASVHGRHTSSQSRPVAASSNCILRAPLYLPHCEALRCICVVREYACRKLGMSMFSA